MISNITNTDWVNLYLSFKDISIKKNVKNNPFWLFFNVIEVAMMKTTDANKF